MIVSILAFTAACDGVLPNGSRCADENPWADWLGWDMEALYDALEEAHWVSLPDGRHYCWRCVGQLRQVVTALVPLLLRKWFAPPLDEEVL